MSLSVLVSSLTSTTLPEVALLLFFVVFLAVAVRAWSAGQREVQEHARHLPLDDAEQGGAHE